MDRKNITTTETSIRNNSIATSSNNSPSRPVHQSIVSSVKQRIFSSLQSRYRNQEPPKITVMRAILQLRTEKGNIQAYLNDSKLEFQRLTSEEQYFDSNKAKRLKKKMERAVGKIDMVEKKLIEEKKKLKEAAREDVLKYANGEEGFFIFPERYPIG